jgi:putative tricarboxylic transport membrane protein
MLIFGLIGYFFRKFDYEGAPLVLAMILSPIFERALGQSLKISDGSFMIFLTRPISLGFLIGAFLFYLIPYLTRYKEKIRDSGFDDAT